MQYYYHYYCYNSYYNVRLDQGIGRDTEQNPGAPSYTTESPSRRQQQRVNVGHYFYFCLFKFRGTFALKGTFCLNRAQTQRKALALCRCLVLFWTSSKIYNFYYHF